MKTAVFFVVGVLMASSESSRAILYIPPLEERVPGAEIIVVGTINHLKSDEVWQSGQLIVERVLKGNVNANAKIPVRWKAPPPPGKTDPNLPQVADYTFRPKMDFRQVIILQPRKDAKGPYELGWGSTELIEDEQKIKDALTAKAK